MKFGKELAELMADLVGNISARTGYIISKGGITTQMLLAKGLKFKSVELKGQILPGLSMVISTDIGDNMNLPVLAFPGNLGDENTLKCAWKLMEGVS